MDSLQDIEFRFVTVETSGDYCNDDGGATVDVRLQVRKLHRRGNKTYWSDWETIPYKPNIYIIEEGEDEQVRDCA